MLDLASVSDSTFFVAVLTASLAGSAHCVGMCGGLVLASTNEKTRTHLAYHVSRLLGYLVLGAFAGLLGSVLLSNSLSGWVGMVSAVALALGFLQLAWTLWRGESPSHRPLTWLGSVSRKVLPQTFRLPPFWRASATGFLSVLLPCGWLYGFVLAAVATRSPLRGAAVIFVFWVGTLPALSLGGIALRKALLWSQQGARRGVAILFVALGLLTLGMRFYPHAYVDAAPASENHSCH